MTSLFKKIKSKLFSVSVETQVSLLLEVFKTEEQKKEFIRGMRKKQVIPNFEPEDEQRILGAVHDVLFNQVIKYVITNGFPKEKTDER